MWEAGSRRMEGGRSLPEGPAVVLEELWPEVGEGEV